MFYIAEYETIVSRMIRGIFSVMSLGTALRKVG